MFLGWVRGGEGVGDCAWRKSLMNMIIVRPTRYGVDVICCMLSTAYKYHSGFTICSAWSTYPAHGSKTPNSVYLIP